MAEEQLDLLSFAEARAVKEAVMDELNENHKDWRLEAMGAFVRLIQDGALVTGEDIRVRLLNAGLPKPRHHNAWGGFIYGLKRRKILVAIGRQPMRGERAHARVTDVFRVQHSRGIAA